MKRLIDWSYIILSSDQEVVLCGMGRGRRGYVRDHGDVFSE